MMLCPNCLKAGYKTDVKKVISVDGNTFKGEKIFYCFDCNFRYTLKGELIND